MFGESFPNGSTFSNPDSSKACEQCECTNGRVQCQQRRCDCSVQQNYDDVTCCQHCKKQESQCRGNRSSNAVYEHGSRWTVGCVEYSCSNGQVHAQPVRCPYVQCRPGTLAVRHEGHCCSVCQERDLCGDEQLEADSQDFAAFCNDGLQVYNHTTQWTVGPPFCLTCLCRVSI